MVHRVTTLINYGMIAIFGLVLVQRLLGSRMPPIPGFGSKAPRPELLPPGLLGEIRTLLDEGRMFEAITAYRNATGKSISEAMDVIDRLKVSDRED